MGKPKAQHPNQHSDETLASTHNGVHNAASLIIGIDTDAVVRYLNPAAEARFGWTIDDARGRSLELLLPVGPGILKGLASGDHADQLAEPPSIRAQTRAGEPLLVKLTDIVDQEPRLLMFEPC